MSVLVQVGLNSAHFRTQARLNQYGKPPIRSLQAQLGPQVGSRLHGTSQTRSGVEATLPFPSSLLSARSLPALLLGQGGDVITYFKDLEQRSYELSEADLGRDGCGIKTATLHLASSIGTSLEVAV